MSNKTTFQEKNERLNANNTNLTEILNTINNLPEAGGGGNNIGEYFNLEIQPTSGIFYQTFIKKIPSVDLSRYTSLRGLLKNYTSLEEVETLNVENSTTLEDLFSGCSKLKKVGNILNTNNITSIGYMFYNCYALIEAPSMNTSNVTSAASMFAYARSLKTIPEYDFSKVYSISSMFNQQLELANIGGFKNLGKGYTATSANNSICELRLSAISNNALTYESLMNVINKLYDLNLTYDVANGGTLYTQKLILGYNYLNKLTADEIAIATNKGWTVS